MKFEKELYSEHILNVDDFNHLKKYLEYKENSSTPSNKALAGNIESEYVIQKMDKVIIDQFEKWATDFFQKNYPRSKEDPEINLILSSLWVNKQKKYEFNPLHNHSGVISFVCWVQIPYDLDEELNLDNCKNSNNISNSLFEFVYIDHLGEILTEKLKIDKSWEGKCIFFDSRLKHQVYPFYTSDDYRISISGNFERIPVKGKNFEYK